MYEFNIHNLYNLIEGQTNEQLWKKAASKANLQLIPCWLFDYPQEALLIKPIWKTPHPIYIPGDHAAVQHHQVHKLEHNCLTVQVP